ncbi:hypothetical protein [Salinibaculum salinum]|uniref:hypothetical protein n=1 Tax=Salinibaculum salinum TaxID=3131996 RepID=UPI0030EF5D9E
MRVIRDAHHRLPTDLLCGVNAIVMGMLLAAVTIHQPYRRNSRLQCDRSSSQRRHDDHGNVRAINAEEFAEQIPLGKLIRQFDENVFYDESEISDKP